jgi:hypothetical protein
MSRQGSKKGAHDKRGKACEARLVVKSGLFSRARLA